MTDSFDTAPDPDDRPLRTPPPLAPGLVEPMPRAARADAGFARGPVPRRSRGGRVFRWWLGASAVLLLLFVACVAIGVGQFDFLPLHIVIDGNDITDGLRVDGLGGGGQALLGIGGLLAVLLALLLLPVLLLLVTAIVLVSVLVGLGIPLIGLAIALVVVSSPLWIVGGLVWLIARDRHPVPRRAPSATMNA